MIETVALLVLAATAAPPADAVITRVEVWEELLRLDKQMCDYASGERWDELIRGEFLRLAEKGQLPLALPQEDGAEPAPEEAPPRPPASPDREVRVRIVLEACGAEVIDRSTAKVAPNEIDLRLQARVELRLAGVEEPFSTDVVAAQVLTERVGRLSQEMYGRAFVATAQELTPRIVERVRFRLAPPREKKEPSTKFVPYRPRR
jgi:hypothetical protein